MKKASTWLNHLHHGRLYLTRHPLQSLLSGFGIAFALCLLTLTHASRRGTYRSMMQEFEGLGRKTALLYVHEQKPLPERFFQTLARYCKQRQWQFIPVYETQVWVNLAGLPHNARLLSSVSEFQQLFRPLLQSGRILEKGDHHLDRLLIGATLADKVQFLETNPHIKLAQRWFQVTGVVEKLQAGGGQVRQFLDMGGAALVIRTLEDLADRKNPLKFALIRVDSEREILELGRLFEEILRAEKLEHLRLDLRLPLEQQELASRSEQLLLAHGSLVSGVCLFLGSLGILISYQLQLGYRREEFGTMVALGASKAYICKNLFMEVLLLASLSGLVGLIFGLLFTLVWSHLGASALYIHAMDMVQSLITLCLVSLLTGSVPALLVLRLDAARLLRFQR